MALLEHSISNVLYSNFINLLEMLHLKTVTDYKKDYLNTLKNYPKLLEETLDEYNCCGKKDILYDFYMIISPTIKNYIVMEANVSYASPNYAPIGPKAGNSMITYFYLDILAGSRTRQWKQYGYKPNKMFALNRSLLIMTLCKMGYKKGYLSKNDIYYFWSSYTGDYDSTHHDGLHWMK